MTRGYFEENLTLILVKYLNISLGLAQHLLTLAVFVEDLCLDPSN